MKYFFSVPLFSLAFFISCTNSGSGLKEEVVPRIQEGFYKIEGSIDEKNLPLVAIVKADGKTHAYSFFSHKCREFTSSSFKLSGTTLSDNPVSAAGPNVKFLTSGCEVETDIVAQSTDSIKAIVNNELNEDEEYTLSLTTKDDFLSTMKSLIANSAEFEIEEDACLAAFEVSCNVYEVRNKALEE